MTKHTPDYAVRMRDRTGRVVVLSINGASIDEMVRDGYSRSEAVESVEGNTFQNAIARGEIGADAYIAADDEVCAVGHKHRSGASAHRCDQLNRARAARAARVAAKGQA